MTGLLFCVGLGMLLGLEEAGAFLLPGDISLVAAAVHGRAYEGPGFFVAAWIVATVAMVGGASVLFHGVRQSRRLDRVLPQRVRGLVQQHGALGIAVARILPGLRNATVFAAASSNVPYRTFLEGLTPAAALWSALLLVLGWFGGDAILGAVGMLHHSRVLGVVSVILLVAAAFFIAVRLWTTRRHHHQEPSEATLQ